MARVGTGCLVLLGLALLLPAFVLTLVAALSAASPATATAPATVLSIEAGIDEDGQAHDHCYTVEYDVDRPRTHRTCVLLPAAQARGRYEPEETEAEAERRFVAEHPVGSTVEVLYEVDDPSQVQGAVSDPEVARSGGSPLLSAVTGGAALLLVTGSFFAFRGARRTFRAAVSPGAGGGSR
jgi:hypothetical protein